MVSVVTQVEVDPADPAFADPTKPVGPFYTAETAGSWPPGAGTCGRTPDSGWRRVVPSPRPLRIVEQEVVTGLIGGGAVVIAAGGGGVPVRAGEDGALAGVEAVIDKDRAAAVLARSVEADLLLILTDVPNVKLNYGKPNEVTLRQVSVAQLEAYAQMGHFAAGSMGPKVEASLEFVKATGKRAVIAALNQAAAAVAGEAGTQVIP